MKTRKLLSLFVTCLLSLTLLHARNLEVADFSYNLDNGASIHVTEGWAFTSAELTATRVDSQLGANESYIQVSVRQIGELFDAVNLNLSNPDHQYQVQTPEHALKMTSGNYNATCELLVPNGAIAFQIRDIHLKGQTLYRLKVLINHIQIFVDATEQDIASNSLYRVSAQTYKNEKEPQAITEWVNLYDSFKEKNQKEFVEGIRDNKAKIEAGRHALKIHNDILRRSAHYVIWLDAFPFEPNRYYDITINLNGGYIEYASEGNPSLLQFYPQGSSDTLGLNEDKSLELFGYEGINTPGDISVCPVGAYDVLKNFDYGARYEWIQGVSVQYGKVTKVK